MIPSLPAADWVWRSVWVHYDLRDAITSLMDGNKLLNANPGERV